MKEDNERMKEDNERMKAEVKRVEEAGQAEMKRVVNELMEALTLDGSTLMKSGSKRMRSTS